MKKYLYIALAALGMMGCSDDTFEQDGEGVGYLRLELGKVDVELSSLTKAEADPLPNDLVPAKADFMVDVKMGGKSVDGFPKQYSEIGSGGIELKAGTYTVIAYHGEDEPIQATPYFEGSSTVQINPGQATHAEIEAALANAMLVPTVSESLQKHYSDWTLTAIVGDASLTLADNENADGYLFVQAERAVNAVFQGTNLLENKTTHEWTVISSAAKQTRYVIQCDPDLSVFSNIQVTATATHTYAEDGSLTGTDVALNLAANGAPLELVDGWNIQLLYNNTPIRTYTSKPENGTLMDVTKGWPYVPQGSALTASIHLETGEMINLTAVEIGEIPQPEFTATVSGSTSYSVYLDPAQGAAVANTKDGSSIFDITATTNIAPEILNNPNYSNLLKVTYTTDSEQNSRELLYGTSTQFNSLPWQKHALSATVSFDGVRVTSSPLDCHVTGLPYTPEAMVEADWDLASWNCEYNNGTIQLGDIAGSGECTATSKMAFYIPDNISVQLNTDVTLKAYKLVFWYNTTFTVKVNGTTIISQGSNDTEKFYSLSGVETFSPEAYQVKLNSSRETINVWSKVHSLHILYN